MFAKDTKPKEGGKGAAIAEEYFYLDDYPFVVS